MKGTCSCLLHLADNKTVTVEDMFSLDWGEGGEAWKWWRRLLAWDEEQVRERCMLLHPIVLQTNVSGRWTWQLHVSSKYNVSSAYNYLLSMDQPINVDHSNNLWHKEVHLKVNLFAWPLLRNYIPTTYNFIKWRYFNQILRYVQPIVTRRKISTIIFCLTGSSAKFGLTFIID
jgi:hypothetical protein